MLEGEMRAEREPLENAPRPLPREGEGALAARGGGYGGRELQMLRGPGGISWRP